MIAGAVISTDDDRSIMAAVRAITDELTFVGTHDVDTGYWVYPKSGSRRATELEAQQSRLRRSYGQMSNPTPHYVEQELLRLFRPEADSVELKKYSPNEPCKIDLMSANDLRVVKKDLKQRIHEWEGSYRREAGREAGPQDKLPLRRVYEAYKETKGRLAILDGGGPAPPPPATAHQPPPPTVTPTPPASTTPSSSQRGGAPPIAARPQNPPPPGGAAPPTSIRARTMSDTSSPTPAPQNVSTTGSSRGSGQFNTRGGISTTSVGNAQQPPASYPAVPKPSNTTASSRPSSAGGASVASSSINTPLGNISGFTPLSQLSDEDIKAEKRKLKRELHSFENAFRERHGREPRKEDREEVVKQYQRYAQLKAALSE